MTRARLSAESRVHPDRASGRLKSSYLRYLPGFYEEDDFLARFLLIFEQILAPIERTISNIPYYLDPRLTPEALLPWLASWVDLVLDERWPLEKRRLLVRRAADLYRWRGTARGLKAYLQIYAGVEPLVIENTSGMALSPDARLGVNTQVDDLRDHCFVVTLPLADPEALDMEIVHTIIRSMKPAHTAYEVRIVSPVY